LKNLRDMEKPIIKTKLPGPKAKELLKIREEYVPIAVFNSNPNFIKRGEGAVIEDVDGNILLDFVGGIGVLNVGYSHAEVIEVVKSQAEKYFHTCTNAILNEPFVKLAKKMSEITPGNFKKKTMFTNSGAESVENAIKVAKKYTHKTDIICFEGAFHGRTHLAMSLTSKVKPYSFGYGPFTPGVHKIPYANCYRCVYGLKKVNCNLRCAERLNEIFNSIVSEENVAAVILEPIQGEGGFILPPDEFITKIKEICKKNNILLIVDEVQTGFCRTGKMFASEYWDIVPDIIITAKSLAGGIPLGAITGRKEIMDAPGVGEVGTTFGGNPLACISALKVIEIIQRDNFSEKALKIGKIAFDKFSNMKKKYPIIGDVRGRGAMVAIELVKDRMTKEPAKEETKEIIKEAFENGLILFAAGLYGNCIRLLVPLVVTKEQLNNGLDIIEKAINKVDKNKIY